MNLAYIEFYNEVLIELDSLLTLTETKSIVRENMEKIKQFCLDEYRKMHIDEKIANKLFNNSEKTVQNIFFQSGLKIKISKNLRNYFNGYSNGYLRFLYDPNNFYKIKIMFLDRMIQEIIRYKEIIPIINIDSLVNAIEIEKLYLKYALENDCEFMQVICGNNRKNTVFDIYGNGNVKLSNAIEPNHVQLISQYWINAILNDNNIKSHFVKIDQPMLEKINYKK